MGFKDAWGREQFPGPWQFAGGRIQGGHEGLPLFSIKAEMPAHRQGFFSACQRTVQNEFADRPARSNRGGGQGLFGRRGQAQVKFFGAGRRHDGTPHVFHASMSARQCHDKLSKTRAQLGVNSENGI